MVCLVMHEKWATVFLTQVLFPDIHPHRQDSLLEYGQSDLRCRAHRSRSSMSQGADNIAHVAKTMLILDTERQRRRNSTSPGPSLSRQSTRANDADPNLTLSRHATIGRNSDFGSMTQADWERVGGIEYRSLKLLLKIVFGKLPEFIHPPRGSKLIQIFFTRIFLRPTSLRRYLHFNLDPIRSKQIH